ncbi:hypothetical protein CN918_32100 [Priestia megaterium]|nr:hypothetical protein CN918_32100 [Priestia megaterium]
MGLPVANELKFTQQLSLEDSWLAQELSESLRKKNIKHYSIQHPTAIMFLFRTYTFCTLTHYIVIDSNAKKPFTITLSKPNKEVHSLSFKKCEDVTSYIKFILN